MNFILTITQPRTTKHKGWLTRRIRDAQFALSRSQQYAMVFFQGYLHTTCTLLVENDGSFTIIMDAKPQKMDDVTAEKFIEQVCLHLKTWKYVVSVQNFDDFVTEPLDIRTPT